MSHVYFCLPWLESCIPRAPDNFPKGNYPLLLKMMGICIFPLHCCSILTFLTVSSVSSDSIVKWIIDDIIKTAVKTAEVQDQKTKYFKPFINTHATNILLCSRLYKYAPNLESLLTQQYVCIKCTLWSDNTCVFTRFHNFPNSERTCTVVYITIYFCLWEIPRNYFPLYFSKERAYTSEGYRMLAFLSI
jgi:hypothetical protein